MLPLRPLVASARAFLPRCLASVLALTLLALALLALAPAAQAQQQGPPATRLADAPRHPVTDEPMPAAVSAFPGGASAPAPGPGLRQELALRRHLAEGTTRGIALAADGATLYRTNGALLELIDVTNPDAPRPINRVRLGATLTQNVTLGAIPGVGTRAFVSTSRFSGVLTDEAGLYVVDVSGPDDVAVTGTLLGRTAFNVTLDGTTGYLAQGTRGLAVLDLTDPDAPAEVGSLATGGSVLDVAVSGTTAFLSAGPAGLEVVDVSDPAAPSLLGSLTINTDAFVTSVDVAGTTAFLSVNGVGLVAVDVSDPANPTEVGRLPIGSSQVRDVQTDGTTAYVSGAFGLVVADVTDPAAPVQLGSVGGRTGAGRSVLVDGTTAYTGERYDGVRIFDVSNPAAIAERASVANGGFSWEVWIDGTRLYVADLVGALRVFDLANPSDPVLLGRIETPPNTQDVVVRNDTAYVADSDSNPVSGLTIFDLADPANPVLVSTFATGNQTQGLALQGRYAYLANGFNETLVVDVADAANPVEVSSFASGIAPASAIAVRDNVGYLANFGAGFTLLDISDPTSLSELSTLSTGNFVLEVALGAGDVAYLADGTNGFTSVDVSDPANPQVLATAGLLNIARATAFGGGYAYVADEGFGVRQFDVTDPANPVETASLVTADRALSVAVSGDTLVVTADGEGGFYILEARERGVPEITLNEVLADPPPGPDGDANGDGTRDASDDEFVEIVNNTDRDQDLSGFVLRDAFGVRHTFAAGTTLPGGTSIVVFGGGTPDGGIPGRVVTASSGALGLNNGGDTVTLEDGAGNVVDALAYGQAQTVQAPTNESLTRDPDFTGPFVPHTTATAADGARFSPGRQVGGAPLPVELSAFDAVVQGGDAALLTWRTASETNNAGFAVEHRAPGQTRFREVAFVEGAGTTTEAQTYRHRTAPLAPGTHAFRLRQLDFDGTPTPSPVVEVTVAPDAPLAATPVYPNPLGGAGRLSVQVREAQDVTVTLYNALGQRMQRLFAGRVTPTQPQPVRLDARGLASGVYFVRIDGATGGTLTRRLTVVR